MIWKRDKGIEVYLQKCDTNVDNADEDEWEGRTKALERKLDTWGNDIHSRIETFQEALENFEDRINRNHEKKINDMGKALESKISELYEMLKNIQPALQGRSSEFELNLR
jgi:predicted phage gp36 major capsid-like protein